MHERTKFRLHSHDVPYGSGSGQQSVTGFPNVDDANSYWVCYASTNFLLIVVSRSFRFDCGLIGDNQVSVVLVCRLLDLSLKRLPGKVTAFRVGRSSGSNT